MPFREKKAWVTLFALLAVFIPYFYFMVGLYHRPEPNYNQLGHLAVLALVAFIVLELLMILVARWLSPEDKGFPVDERERLFAYRAAKCAYVALIALVIAVIFPMIHTLGGNWGWGMSLLAAIIGSELIRAAVLILQYRRGY